MGFMLIIATVLVILVVFAVLIRILVVVEPRIRRIYDKIKQKLFYNAFCRFVLASFLKLQIASIDSIIALYMLQESKDIKNLLSWKKVGVPASIILVLYIAPHIFFFILRRNRANLGTDSFRNRFGTLYLGFSTQ